MSARTASQADPSPSPTPGSSTAGLSADDPALWAAHVADLLPQLGSSEGGLSVGEAARRLAVDGPNAIEGPRGHRGARLLLAQFESPIVLILAGATVVSMALGDVVDGLIILGIIVASSGLGFWQEHTAGRAVDALLAQIRVDVEVRRSGRAVSVPITQVVPGDLVLLAAGDLVPGDGRVLAARGLLVDEAALTGESYPAAKEPGEVAPGAPLAGRSNTVFMGTHVVSGTGEVVVARTGEATEFGRLSAGLRAQEVTTGFERGITQFGLLLVRLVAILGVAIFVLNVVLGRPLIDSFLFSLALAVGLTPQLLPAIVSVSLATGARRMAGEQVIVRRLDAIEDFGAMTVLCTDKTGTLTAGAVRLDRALDLRGGDDAEVLRLAGLNAGLQRDYENPIDAAIVAVAGTPPGERLDEIPYDFRRKRLSVLVGGDDQPTLITKGAFDTVLEVCGAAYDQGDVVPLAEVRAAVDAQFEVLSQQGYRVLALATKELAGASAASASDEVGLTLRGLLAFHDPPKRGVDDAIARLERQGIAIRLVTGDNRLAAAQVAAAVGLDASGLLTGPQLDGLDDDALAARCATVTVFAEMEPLHKQRIVRALQHEGATVGFLGDGINDAVALHSADVGISVDTAVDAAKQTAAIVLLDKDLHVIAQGVSLGRQTFANTLKYIRVTTSANFGNMLSMAAATVFLPFLPLLPRQILLLNFVSDIPGMAIAGDAVDPEQLERPQAWHLRSIRSFMIAYGLISSAFDLATFAVLRLGFDAGASLFRSAWFIESTLTELTVMLVLRTNRPFFRSRPARALLWSSITVAVLTVLLPFGPMAGPLGLTDVPVRVLATLLGLIAAYAAVNEVAKRWLPPHA
ncbi:MAG: magnesium-translocating P-type ATPase [Actinomycetota bacterium]